MPRADQATIELLTDYFQAMEVKDIDRIGAHCADNVTRPSPTPQRSPAATPCSPA